MNAPPRRQPNQAFRVRWTRPHWTTDAGGCPRWTYRWFVQQGAAMRLVRRLHATGADVVMDVYGLHHNRSVTWPTTDNEEMS